MKENSPQEVSVSSAEYERLSTKEHGDTYDIQFERPDSIFFEQFLELYYKIEPREYKSQPISKNLARRLDFWCELKNREISNYIDLTRRLLAYEKSLQKYRNQEKWQEVLLEMDKQRHEIHLKIKEVVRKAIMALIKKKQPDRKDIEIDERKIAFICELLIGSQIANSTIWLTRLYPDEKVKIKNSEIAKDVSIREFEYVSDWHDQGHYYKQVWIDFNPLKYKRKDIEFEITTEK